MKNIRLFAAILCSLMAFLFPVLVFGQTTVAPQYTKTDSIKVERLLRLAAKQNKKTNLVIYFARQLRGVPYVAKTLEVNVEERLIINLRQLDCTTYVETVTALALCAQRGEHRFADYCRQLQRLRYKGGKVAYTSRLHYFTSWIDDNTDMGYVREVSSPNPPFTKVQQLDINFMSTHTQYYPLLVSHPHWVTEIAASEKSLCGRKCAYIPKGEIANTALYRSTIKDGDIIAIITSKKGLDTSHIGIAVWHKDGLHLLNASQIHKKVVEEPMTLRQYMSKHPSQMGIRIVRLLPQK